MRFLAIFAVVFSAAAPAFADPVKWEYQEVPVTGGAPTTDVLSQLGAAGWELTICPQTKVKLSYNQTITVTGSPTGSDYFPSAYTAVEYCIFKRPAQ